MDSGKYLVINMTVMSPRPKGDSCRQLGSEATSSEPDGPGRKVEVGLGRAGRSCSHPLQASRGAGASRTLPAALGERWTQRTITVDA